MGSAADSNGNGRSGVHASVDAPPLHGSLNGRALAKGRLMAAAAGELGLGVSRPGGATVVDAGIRAAGGLSAGLETARICLADLADVSLAAAGPIDLGVPWVQVHTDHPVAACMAAQYAGWRLSVGDYFAMGSGPMRAAYGRESLFDRIGRRERPAPAAVGVLETRRLPSEEVVAHIAERAGVAGREVLLVAAPTASLVGSVQVVARTLETALHKLLELGFDLSRVVAGAGVAPLAPPARDDLQAIGRTNDAVLYAGRATLWVRGDDESLAAVGPRVPGAAGRDYGAPFLEIFEKAGRDFYKVDPMLFSPAQVVFHNLDTGRTHRFGRFAPEVIARSWGM